MDEATAPAVARGWLWTMRLGALSGLVLHAGPVLMPMLRWSGEPSALLGLVPGVTVAAGYVAVLWLLRSEKHLDDVRRGHVFGRAVAAMFLLLSAFWIIAGRREPSLGATLYVCLPPALLLISGWGLARRCPARPAEWARGLPFAVLIALAVYFVMPPPGHGPDYSRMSRSRLDEIVFAERNYAAANGGLFGSLECLAFPRECLSDYPAEAPSFVSPDLLETTQARHRIVFHPGPEASFSDERGQPYSGFRSFAVTAVPLDPDRRSLCADASGQILVWPDGQTPAVKAGACVEGAGVVRWD